ncbi:hypothetical protein RRG08_055365 [Elysia crispata]|uniref:Uncharacterized protein n=1 Tax=Elysia crispata TaxID=231223 RepID=A0AAE1AQJ7_9GAST|nr:hypothetical protein RRG08_055365 [Elysia crispata]
MGSHSQNKRYQSKLRDLESTCGQSENILTCAISSPEVIHPAVCPRRSCMDRLLRRRDANRQMSHSLPAAWRQVP